MEKSEGIHFYVNVENFNDVVLNEEQHTGKVNHSIHALDTFFSSIEYYGKTNFPKSFVVEKITGSRLHMYVVEDIAKAYSIVQEVVKYAADIGPNPYYWTKLQIDPSIKVPKRIINPTYDKFMEIIGAVEE